MSSPGPVSAAVMRQVRSVLMVLCCRSRTRMPLPQPWMIYHAVYPCRRRHALTCAGLDLASASHLIIMLTPVLSLHPPVETRNVMDKIAPSPPHNHAIYTHTLVTHDHCLKFMSRIRSPYLLVSFSHARKSPRSLPGIALTLTHGGLDICAARSAVGPAKVRKYSRS